jgi:hypothetical protein
MIVLNQDTKDKLLKLYDRNIILEGNIVKVIDSAGDTVFAEYLSTCLMRDKEVRRKRLDVTKQVQTQNKELIEWNLVNEKLTSELQLEMVKSEQARLAAENAKQIALTDLDLLQKKSQTELIGTIVKVALFVILGVGVVTTALYVFAMLTGQDTQIIGSTWSNMFGILLTNAFSIVGTIMGVKYASEKKSD